MDGLPDTLQNRFHLYLNILPVVSDIGQLLLFVSGIILVLTSIVRASMRFSKNVQQTTRNISHHQSKYLHLGRDADSEQGSGGGGDGDDDETQGMVSYEMADKRIRSDDTLYEVNLSEEQQYMLEQEHAISEDDDTDDGDRGDKESTGDDSVTSSSRQSYGGGDKDCIQLDMPHLVSGIYVGFAHIWYMSLNTNRIKNRGRALISVKVSELFIYLLTSLDRCIDPAPCMFKLHLRNSGKRKQL